MTGRPFSVPYDRPANFTVGMDFDAPGNEIQYILEKADDQLLLEDYLTIFQPRSPGGEYEEVVYFLPLAIQYIECHADVAADLISGVVSFVSFEARLKEDGLVGPSRDAMLRCFVEWTSAFEIRQADCRGRTCYYVDRSCAVMELIESLVLFKSHSDLAEQMIADLSDPQGSPVRAAWFVELARKHRGLEFSEITPAIIAILSDDTIIHRNIALISELRAIPAGYYANVTMVLGKGM